MDSFRPGFDGMQTASLPGPLVMPTSGRDAAAFVPRPAAHDGSGLVVEERVRKILGSVQVPVDAMNARFFSSRHVDDLQATIVSMVYRELGMRIQRQSDDELLIIMRGIYMMLRPTNPTFEDLDARVIKAAMDSIRTNLEVYKTYMDTDKRIQYVMDRGINTNIRGTKLTY
jgi:hypothetical protein